MKNHLLLWFFALLLSSCSTDMQAGKGVASETTNGKIAGVLKNQDGSAAARVRVELRDPQMQKDSVLAFDTTDAQGIYELKFSQPGRYLVRTSDSSLGSLTWATVGNAKSVDTLQTMYRKPLQTLQGKLTGEVGEYSSLRVLLLGFSQRSVVAADSTFQFTDVAPGNYLVRVIRGDSSGVVLAENLLPTQVQNTLPLSVEPWVLVDDFEGVEGASELLPLLGGAWWGMWNDTSATVDSNTTWVNTEGRSTDSSAYQGKSFHAQLWVGDSFPQRPDIQRSAGVQIKIGGNEILDSNSIWFSMKKIDSLIFWAKGIGHFQLIVHARNAGGGLRGDFVCNVLLDSAWTRYAFATSDFTAPNGLVWFSSQLSEIIWKTTDHSSDLWLDNIELHGIRPADLLTGY